MCGGAKWENEKSNSCLPLSGIFWTVSTTLFIHFTPPSILRSESKIESIQCLKFIHCSYSYARLYKWATILLGLNAHVSIVASVMLNKTFVTGLWSQTRGSLLLGHKQNLLYLRLWPLLRRTVLKIWTDFLVSKSLSPGIRFRTKLRQFNRCFPSSEQNKGYRL